MDVDQPHVDWDPATAGAICAKCNTNAPHQQHVDTLISDAPNTEPWCARCIKNRFDLASNNEPKFPYVRHDIPQHPRMKQYAGIFTTEYIKDYDSKVAEWDIMERRVRCSCDGDPFVCRINPAATLPSHANCKSCGQAWCIRCGTKDDMVGLMDATGQLSPHANAANPGYCAQLLEDIEQWSEDQLASLRFGVDYQVCPRCHRFYNNRNGHESRNEVCHGCETVYCFKCGFARRGQSWLVGYPTCTSDHR